MLFLHIKVIAARNLYPKDSDGYSDSYCVLKLGKEKTQTSVIKNCLNPVWKEFFILPINNNPKYLELTCWDKDFLFRDYLGKVIVYLKDLFDVETGIPYSRVDAKEDELGKWYAFQKRSERSNISGEINLDIRVVSDIPLSNIDWVNIYKSYGGILH